MVRIMRAETLNLDLKGVYMNNSICSYESFAREMLEAVRCRFEDDADCSVEMTSVTKNNQVRSDTIVVRGTGRTCAPVIRVRDLYELFLQGAACSSLADEIADIYYKSAGQFEDLTSDRLLDFDSIKDRLIIKVINGDHNTQLLEDVPCIRKLDLALTFRIMAESYDHMQGSILVDNDLMNMWQVTPEILFKEAAGNMEQLWHSSILPLDEMIKGLTCGDDMEQDQLHTPFLVLTNDRFCYGAAALFCTDLIRDFARCADSDFYILPSSIHEILLVPTREDMDACQLQEMVSSVNREAVGEDEILSDHVYLYERKNDRLSYADTQSDSFCIRME